MKERNPQDATRRNVQAAAKRLKKLEADMKAVLKRLDKLERRVAQVEGL